MATKPSLAQSAASRLNGAHSTGPATEDGKARSARNAVRHGLSGRTFFLLPDEDPEEFATHEAECLSSWRPRDHAEREAAQTAIRAMWREVRGDRLEAQVLTRLFAAERIQAERESTRAAAFRELGMLLRYQARIARELQAAMAALDQLRQRRLADPARQPHEPEGMTSANVRPALAPVQNEPERVLNRHQRRALAAMARQRAA